ncbi:MAG TPA: DUF6152 family protein [Bryobacteraceae bacterium]|nr:DUF6152 family protein [Bryobacteraceae bacterium]
MLRTLSIPAARLAAGVILLAAAAWGHHSFAAEFDTNKPISVTGVIVKVDWINPHAYIYLDAKNASGETVHWAFQTLPPGMMRARGLSRDLLAVGQTVTISGFGTKDGTDDLGWVKKIQFADGRVLQMTAEEEKSK